MIRITTLLLLASLLITSGPALADTRIAFVDIQKALVSIKEGGKVKAKLRKLAEKKKKALKAQEAELMTKQKKLEQGADLMKPDVRQKKAMELRGELLAFQQEVVNSEKELANKQIELTNPLLEKLFRMAELIAKERGFSLVLEKSAVVYAQADMNLTDELIKRCNAGN